MNAHAQQKSTMINLNGIDVYYEFHKPDPSKPVIVLIHGFLSSSFSFRRLIPYLEKEFSVLTVDLPPFGKSGKNLSFRYSYQNLADLVISLLESLKVDKAFLVGHSMGGQITLNIAKRRPDIASKIVLLCSSGYIDRFHYSLIYSSYFPYFYLWLKAWLAKTGVLGSLKNVVYNHALIDEDMVQGYSTPFLDNQIFKALTKMIRDREGDLSSTMLQQIMTPSLLIWGEEDRVVPINVGRRMHQDLKDATFVSFKDTGHLLPEECPDSIYQQITNFIFPSTGRV
ncbi:alpha/beta fold hydrolase [Priestia koreensis]|uniref:alpha/beta fold hydrolase n=1 Tax=Priestia koreensis TaxID=284581 RepID=UPI001F58FDC9|nr:alpha/beta hydrolase [Priestia koreensis]MCM3004409.1 alpha/beta hydrolase [Priestia koreensis]UNL84624.1 alpha/beta hydrolase [Priestia koreensis]